MQRMRVTVVGAGVVGLTAAHELAVAGHEVTVAADRTALESVSVVAGAIWFPYEAELGEGMSSLEERSLARLAALADVPDAGVALLPGLYIEREEHPDRAWASAVPEWREALPDELPAGAPSGVQATLPVVTTHRYLLWLRGRCARFGVRFATRTVADLDTLAGEADLVVVAAGIRSGELLGDDSLYPIRGQIVRVANPGLSRWLIDTGVAGEQCYVVPRQGDVVCGGTADVGAWEERLDPETERAILRRAAELVPQLAGQRVLSRAVGLRPARPTVRIEAVAGYRVPVIACYGHGGSGLTLSWGSAEQVARLAAETA